MYDFTMKLPSAMQQMGDVLNVANAFKQRELADRQMAMKEQAFRATQQKAMRFQRDLANLAEKPTVENILKTWARNPEQHEALKGLMENATEQEKEQNFATLRDLFMLGQNENYEQARSIIQERKQAAINSDDPEQARMLDLLYQHLDESSPLYNPGNFTGSLGVSLSATDRGRKMLESMAGQDKTKSEIVKIDAETRKLNAEANYKNLESASISSKLRNAAAKAELDKLNTSMDIQAKGGDLGFMLENKTISPFVYKAATQRKEYQNLLQKGKEAEANQALLKLEQTQDEIEQKLNTNRSQANSAWRQVAQAKQIIERIKVNPETRNVIGPLEGNRTIDDVSSLFSRETLRDVLPLSGYGPIEKREVGGNRREKRIEAIADIEQLVNVLTLTSFKDARAAGVTFGATTEHEWKLLQTQLANLNRRLGEKAFFNTLDRVANSLDGMYEDIGTKYGFDDNEDGEYDLPPMEKDIVTIKQDQNSLPRLEQALKKYSRDPTIQEVQ